MAESPEDERHFWRYQNRWVALSTIAGATLVAGLVELLNGRNTSSAVLAVSGLWGAWYSDKRIMMPHPEVLPSTAREWIPSHGPALLGFALGAIASLLIYDIGRNHPRLWQGDPTADEQQVRTSNLAHKNSHRLWQRDKADIQNSLGNSPGPACTVQVFSRSSGSADLADYGDDFALAVGQAHGWNAHHETRALKPSQHQIRIRANQNDPAAQNLFEALNADKEHDAEFVPDDGLAECQFVIELHDPNEVPPVPTPTLLPCEQQATVRGLADFQGPQTEEFGWFGGSWGAASGGTISYDFIAQRACIDPAGAPASIGGNLINDIPLNPGAHCTDFCPNGMRIPKGTTVTCACHENCPKEKIHCVLTGYFEK